jgi:hypothetical protein
MTAVKMTPDEIEMLTSHLVKDINYLEFGAGGSTLLALKRGVERCDSVETDRLWVRKLREDATIEFAERCGQLVFHQVDVGPTRAWGMPADESGLRRWPNYFLKAWSLLEEDPDLVLIDGRFRAACGLCALIVCDQTAAILVHDFCAKPSKQRENYHRLLEFADVTERKNTLVRLTRKASATERKMLGVLADTWNDFW